MNVDSFKFLPRSFRPLYEPPARLAAEGEPVWTAVKKRLADMSVTLLSSAGLYMKDSQPSFDLERERREPAWGDPGWRRLPRGVRSKELAMAHLHVNSADVLADPDIALPVNVLEELIVEGLVGDATAEHVSVMGYQEHDLGGWREHTVPEIVSSLRSQASDGVVLAPV